MSAAESSRARGYDLSIVMPCYNEESIVGYTIPKLMGAFRSAGHSVELVAVDNGSRDRTGEILARLAAAEPGVRPHRVEVNQGYGWGVLKGIEVASAPWVCIIPADGQVDAEDVVRLFEAAAVSGETVIAKVRRRFRMDGLLRKIVSAGYNVFVRVLWPRLATVDVNGSPKIAPRALLMSMDLKSKDWFLDPEILLKGHYMGARVLEVNVFARLRGNGLSNVKPSACIEFTRNLLKYRFSSAWKQGLPSSSSLPAPAPLAPLMAGTEPLTH